MIDYKKMAQELKDYEKHSANGELSDWEKDFMGNIYYFEKFSPMQRVKIEELHEQFVSPNIGG